MDTTFGQIIGKYSDYKICQDCSAHNWYENILCQGCSSKPPNFKDMTEEDADNLLQEIKEFNKENPTDQAEDSGEHWCLDCATDI